MKEKNKEKINIQEILEEYKPNDDLFSEEDEKINHLKHIIYENLSEADKRIILLYAECGNLREVGNILNVSHTTIFYKIRNIKNIINEYYD